MNEIPDFLAEGWMAFRDPRKLVAVDEISAAVSTNHVYRLHLDDASRVIAKVSSYGSFVHFRQDHQRISQWIRNLRGTRYGDFLAPVLGRGGGAEPFVYREGPLWMVLYGELPVREKLPRILNDIEIEELAQEIARFHGTCGALCTDLQPTWKTLGSDIAQLRQQLESPAWCDERAIGNATADFLRENCDAFLTNADESGYHLWPKIPTLVDWNIGNFSVDRGSDGMRLYSRWDYDWFRIEPRAVDFYFLSRVVSAIGDRTQFTYGPEPLVDPRFQRFLRAYHDVTPLRPEELAFVREAYRFFLLNYVVRDGEHFFREDVCEQLRRDVIELHLPSLHELNLSPLLEVAAPAPPRRPSATTGPAERNAPGQRTESLGIQESFLAAASQYRVVFFDAFGVLKNSRGILDGVPDMLAALRDAGVCTFVLTNDASRSPEAMAKRYVDTKHGALIPPRRIVSSGLLASSFLATKIPAGKVGYLGKRASAHYVEAAGHQAIPVGDCERIADQLKAFVLLDDEGFDWFADLNRALNLLRRRPIPAIVANPDLAYPVDGHEVAVAIGSLGELLQRIVGRTFFRFGKPDTQIFDYAFDLARREIPALRKTDVLMVGDTVEMDILGGNKFGIDTALVLSGNTTPEAAPLAIEASGLRPTAIFESVAT